MSMEEHLLYLQGLQLYQMPHCFYYQVDNVQPAVAFYLIHYSGSELVPVVHSDLLQ